MTYLPSPALATDLYQLTMAQGYLHAGLADRRAVFHLFFRRSPFQGGYAVAAGLAPVLDFLSQYSFAEDDLQYLGQVTGADGKALFRPAFLQRLGTLKLDVTLDAVPEGTLVFPHQPLLRIEGPLDQVQLLETALLNLVNFQTLVATKAARMCAAAQGEPVLEFGFRRAQGMNGALAASRAAYIGGCDSTSNVLAGKLFGIPVKGTHAHSWVMCFDSELESFETYADAMPNNCVFLVDTYDTLEGVENAIAVGRRLREKGHDMVGVRLDSGDLAELSIGARRLLDEAGFQNAAIVASNDLDEDAIRELKARGAKIGVWGIGTKLATAYDQPALGGVYKLGAIESEAGQWEYRIKLSEQPIKVSNPGLLGVRRLTTPEGEPKLDVIYDTQNPPTEWHARDPMTGEELAIPEGLEGADLLVPVLRRGEQIYETPTLAAVQARTRTQLASFAATGVTSLESGSSYPVGLEAGLFELKTKLMQEAGS